MRFEPIDPTDLSWLRRAMMPLRGPVNRALRWLWRRTPHARSTWFDSHRFRLVWNANRWFAATPRRHRTPVEVQFAPGVRMELDLSRLTDVLAFCYGPGEFEVGHAAALLCPDDGVVVDVGGNIGTTALSFAATARRGAVHVFEPSRDMLRQLRRNIELSGARNVVVHPCGLADAPARARIEVAIAGNPGSGYVAPAAADGGDDAIDVRCMDDVLGDLPRLDFVKIDVEGLELRVLRGADALLRRHRPAVLLEINEQALARAGTSGAAVCAHLQQLGYSLAWLRRGVLQPYDPGTMLERRMHNVIAVHPSTAAVDARSRRALRMTGA
ncbi:MAG: FkbM family methyltransferase [Planctomycetota bacterium]